MRHVRRAMRADRISLRIDTNKADICVKITAQGVKNRTNAGLQAHALLDIIGNLTGCESANYILAGAGGRGGCKF